MLGGATCVTGATNHFTVVWRQVALLGCQATTKAMQLFKFDVADFMFPSASYAVQATAKEVGGTVTKGKGFPGLIVNKPATTITLGKGRKML